jgi:hypothetical protein
MEYDYALAFALANNALCLFTGAGVSKHLTAGSMPDWRSLLEEACGTLTAAARVKAQFDQARVEFPLEDCAQIIELAFLREDKDFRKALAEIVLAKSIEPSAAAEMQRFLVDHPTVDVITTNYDLLIETLLPHRCNSNFPGRPVSRRDNCVDVFHVHGCVLNPSSLVVTTNDYYRFVNDGGYFSQKVSTMLHENSTVILGYSLSDPNLKAILNHYRATSGRAINRGNLFYVTRGVVPAHIRDYYEAAYGIAVIENTEIDALLKAIQLKFHEAQVQLQTAEENLRKVLHENHSWSEKYLGLRDSLFHIVATANTNGHDVHSAEFAQMLANVLSRKEAMTRIGGAWDQYTHLAEWLVYLASIMDLQGTPLESTFLAATKHSMMTMSKSYTRGYSWASFQVWNSKWESLTFKNKMLVRQFVVREINTENALEVVMQESVS